MVTESKKKSNAKWDSMNKKKMTFGFMVNTDADIIEWIESLPSGSKLPEIKKAIRSYIKSQEPTKGE